MDDVNASLSDSDISILSDIGQFSVEASDADKQRAVERLCRTGFIKRQDQPRDTYSLTAKGEKLLSSRGAGLNEA